uniref:Beta-galactosidase-1-like protein 2 n=1 Tax=Gadus morhua TaxID=8049 RepID=A0A8C5B1K7_GADMO
MVVLRIRNSHKRKYAFICLSIFGFIMYRYLGTPVGGRRLSRKLGLHANNSQFTLAGEPFRILGGSVHYFRVPSAYWRDRLMKAKACGINTITTYVPWSLHQPERDVFNFQTQLDLESYISLVAELGLWVILRPGPYISAELDLGGLPSWLLQDENMRLRTTYPGFTDAVNVFFDKLIPKIVPLQFKKGGPIIAIQLDDSYGSYAKDNRYMAFIKEALTSRGVSEMLLTSDLSNGLKAGGPNSPAMVTDIWSGMADAWGDLHHVLAPEDMVSTVREILRRGMSINLYMFHGGTSFGFMSGALGIPSYKAIVPSYDYDAPLSEAGEYTPKYHLLRDLFSRYNSESEQKPYEPAIMYNHLSLWDALSFTEEPFKSATPVNMENLPVNNKNGQSQGYTLYETTITSGGLLKSGDNVRDRALVSDLSTATHSQKQKLGKRTLSLLVENCGRVHRGKDLDKQRKGLVGDVLLNGTPLRDFTIYSLDMKPSFIDSLYRAQWKARPEVPLYPAFLMGALFAYGYPSDTFVKLPGWGRGVVFINGLNLGRYWSSGPQQALYLPGPFLNSGMNQIIAFEEQEADYKIQLEDTHDLGMTADIK